MNAENLKKLYGSTPESFRQSVEQALNQSSHPVSFPHRAPVRRALRLALVCALLLALLTAAAYAVFSPRVAEVFGAAYGPAAQEKLQAGKSAQPESSIDLDGVRYTLHEVTYIDSGLYAVATIRPADGSKIVLLSQEEDDPDTPVGTDRYNAIHPGPDAPTYGEKAAETGAKLIYAEIAVDQIAVDGGPALPPACYGVSSHPQEDGSVLYTLEIDAGTAVTAGESYTLHLWVSHWEYDRRDETYEGEEWLVTVTPKAAEEKGE